MKFILIIMMFNTILSSQEAKGRCKLGFGMEYAPSLIVLGSEQPTPSVYFPIIKNNPELIDWDTQNLVNFILFQLANQNNNLFPLPFRH